MKFINAQSDEFENNCAIGNDYSNLENQKNILWSWLSKKVAETIYDYLNKN